MVVGALLVVGVKPLLDIQGKKVPYNTLDAGMVALGLGAAFMVGAFLSQSLLRRSVRTPLTVALCAVLFVAALSAVDLVLLPVRADFLEVFEQPRPELFGPYVSPVKGTLISAGQFLVGFAALALLACVLVRPDLLPVSRLRRVILLVLLGALVHTAIAWLQVIGVVPYSFFFRLPENSIGRASGAYYHPATLGHLLIFSVFLVYVAGDRLGMRTSWRYGLIGLFSVTALVTLHRTNILGIAIVITAFEARRIPSLLRIPRLSSLRLHIALPAGLTLAALLAASAILLGATVWNRAVLVTTKFGFLRGRGEIWSEIADTWSRAPVDVWLIGLGFEPWDSHNDGVRVTVVWGLLGVLTLGLLLANLWTTTWRRLAPEGRSALVVLYLLLAAIAFTQKPTAHPYLIWLFVLAHLALLVLWGDRSNGGDRAISSGGRL